VSDDIYALDRSNDSNGSGMPDDPGRPNDPNGSGGSDDPCRPNDAIVLGRASTTSQTDRTGPMT